MNLRVLVFICGMASLAPFCLLAQSPQELIAAVIAAEKARGAAMKSADTNALKIILADDLRYTHSDAHLESKTDHIGSFVAGLRFTQFDVSKLVGHVISPDVVVLTGEIDQTKGYSEKWQSIHLLFQGVWRRSAGQWQLASLQTAAPPQTPK
jgi:hypothetical protein